MAPIDNATATILITTLCGTIGSLATAILNYFREGRAHDWQVKQAELDRKDRERIAAEVKAHAAYAANVVAADSRETAKALSTKLDENTEISVRAFDEANGVNKKILAIGELRVKDGRTDPVKEVTGIVKETSEAVHRVETKIDTIIK